MELHEDLDLLKEKRQVDCLLESLLFLATYHQRATSKESLIYGLGIHGDVMNLEKFIESAKRIGLICKSSYREKITDIDNLALPAVIFTNDNNCAVLVDYDTQENIASVLLPHISEGETKISIDELQERFTGRTIIVKPAYNFERDRKSVV